MPSDPEGFDEIFDRFWNVINLVSDRCFELLGTATNEHGDTYMSEELFQEVNARIRQRYDIHII